MWWFRFIGEAEMRGGERVHLSLGSNVGDSSVRIGRLLNALLALRAVKGVRLVRVSDCYETEPVGDTDQPAFLNLAAEIETVLEPLELLNAVKDIERMVGRTPSERWGPREIDIDIVLWGPRVMDTRRLALPHKEFRKRAFVLRPLADIAPDAVDPVSGSTVAQLAAGPDLQGRVLQKIAVPWETLVPNRNLWTRIGSN
jgi:2-amino-4-hydroxy-6-hydroxymethyldihydropteridine diphosphokinase